MSTLNSKNHDFSMYTTVQRTGVQRFLRNYQNIDQKWQILWRLGCWKFSLAIKKLHSKHTQIENSILHCNIFHNITVFISCMHEMSPKNLSAASLANFSQLRSGEQKTCLVNWFLHFSSVLRKSLYERLKYHHIPQLSLTMKAKFVVNPFGLLQHVRPPHAVVGFI